MRYPDETEAVCATLMVALLAILIWIFMYAPKDYNNRPISHKFIVEQQHWSEWEKVGGEYVRSKKTSPTKWILCTTPAQCWSVPVELWGRVTIGDKIVGRVDGIDKWRGYPPEE